MLISKAGYKATFLINSLGGGGAEGVCLNLANELADKGWDITIVTMNLRKRDYLERLNDKVRLIDLGISNARYAFLPMAKYFSKISSQTILVFNYELAVLLVFIRKILRLNFRIVARNINTLSEKRKQAISLWRKFVVMPLINKLFFEVDFVLNQCIGMQNDLLQCTNINKKKIGVIHNPVNKLIESYVVNNGISDLSKKSYILCVGRLEKQKAFHYAIIAFSRIIEQYPDLRLKIVGKGILEPQLRALCDELQISNLVDFEGFNQDVISYYLEAKLTLLTSLYEGFPNVLVESISLGTPVVAVDCQSGPREIITKDNGYLVPPADLDALVGAISKALNREWDVEAILTSSEKFSLQYAIAKYEELLR